MHAHCIAALTSLVVVVSCSDSQPAPPAVTPAARATFKTRCTPCHGDSGHGDGPFAAKLDPKPPNFADTAWQKSVTDEQIRKVIVFGGPAVGKGSGMPAVHELEGKPELDELLALIRGM